MDSGEGAADHELRQSRLSRFGRVLAVVTLISLVLTVFDYGRTADGVFYYAMELLEGASLDEIVHVDGPQPEERVIHLLEQAAGSLAEAHDAGLIHRDIKPGNILVVDRGGISDLVKVVDFGYLTRDHGRAGGPLCAWRGRVLTADRYARLRRTLDHRSMRSSYAFGARPSARLGTPVTPDLEKVLLACLAKRPDDRPDSAHDLRERLRACAAAGRWTNSRAATWWAIHRRQVRSGGARSSPVSSAADSHTVPLTVTRVVD